MVTIAIRSRLSVDRTIRAEEITHSDRAFRTVRKHFPRNANAIPATENICGKTSPAP